MDAIVQVLVSTVVAGGLPGVLVVVALFLAIPTAVPCLVLYSLKKGWLRTKQEIDQVCKSLEREQAINDKVLPAIEKLTTAFEQLTKSIELVLRSQHRD